MPPHRCQNGKEESGRDRMNQIETDSRHHNYQSMSIFIHFYILCQRAKLYIRYFLSEPHLEINTRDHGHQQRRDTTLHANRK